MQTLGFKVNNDGLEKNSWYFRNALVRANYNDVKKNIHASTVYLERFFSNLILETEYELKNRYMHVDYVDDEIENVIENIIGISEERIRTLIPEYSSKKIAKAVKLLNLIAENPRITISEIKSELGVTERTVARYLLELKNKKIIKRN